MHRPALVLRNTTEWTELFDVGAALLCPEPDALMGRFSDVIKNDFKSVFEADLFGDGQAAQHIATALQAWFQK
jgi:UDP-N-acetylglucosamine 2-epimerase